MRNYKIRFSYWGIAAVILVMLPNLLYAFLSPPSDPLSNNEAVFGVWNVLENAGRFGLMISLCVISNRNDKRHNRALDTVAVGSLVVYYILWIVYFAGNYNEIMLVGMAFFPSLFFILISWKLRNVFAQVFSLLFGAMHIVITGSNFLF